MSRKGIKRYLRRHVLARFILAGTLLFAFIALFYFGALSLGPAPFSSIYFRSPSGTESSRFLVEIADTEPLRTKGLMYRKELPARTGMLFIFPDESYRTFWMHNTYISLDMIFVNSKREIVTILERVPALNDTPRASTKPAQYVVELPAGTVAENQIQPNWILVGDF